MHECTIGTEQHLNQIFNSIATVSKNLRGYKSTHEIHTRFEDKINDEMIII